MEAVVIGLGSMGKRRIRLLKQSFKSINIRGTDMSESRRQETFDTFGIPVYPTLEKALLTPCDYAFVCTAPLSHSRIILQCLSAGLHVFTELNLVSDDYDKMIRLAEEKEKILFLSSTFLYREDVNFLINRINKETASLSYTYHVGQYLPDWHPWESHKNFFVGEKRTGGCRELLAVELPWLLKAFGDIKAVSSHSYTMSSLELPYPDTVFVHTEHISGAIGQLLIDVVTRVPVRHFEVFGENLQLEWRGKPEDIWVTASDYNVMEKVDLKNEPQRQQGYRDFIVEDAYSEEIRVFFDFIQNKCKPKYTFEDDLRTLKVIDEILGAGY